MSKSWKIQNDNYLSAESVWIEPNTTGSSQIDGKNLSTALKNLGSDVISVERGGTGATIASKARENLGVQSTLLSHDISNFSLASGSKTTLKTLTFGPGTWVIICGANFHQNATGWRACWLTTNSQGGNNNTGESAHGMSEANTYLHAIWTIRTSGTTTYYFRAYQNSGTALNTNAGIRAMRFTFY